MDKNSQPAKPDVGEQAATIIQQTYPAYAGVLAWCALSGMGRSSTYEALARHDLRAIKLGARTLIDVAHGLAWLDSLPAATIRPHGKKRTLNFA